MTLAGGVDGGGTKTRCLVFDESWTIMALGVTGASKPHAASPVRRRVVGWVCIGDDEGRGFCLGRQAGMAVGGADDGGGARPSHTEPILDALGIHDIIEVMHRILQPRLDHAGIAALAPLFTANAD